MEYNDKPNPNTKFEEDDGYFGCNSYPSIEEFGYYIEGRKGEFLIGCSMLKGEKSTKEYCRIANMAHRIGGRNTVDEVREKLTKISQEIGWR